MRGRFIVFEGLDGSGQSTQAEMLTRSLNAHLTKEPTNGLIGGLIRGSLQKDWNSTPECLQLLFAADRAHHLKKEITPLLNKGVDVVCDRYLFSTIAFGSLEIDDWQYLKEINKRFMLPDVVFYLKVSPKTCIQRIKEGRNSFELFEEEKKLEKIEKGYERLAKEYDIFKVIDGERSVKDVAEEINKIVKSVF